jgi:hypothetical protein
MQVAYPAMAKMTANDMLDFANTDSSRLLGELSKAVRIGIIKCLSEIGDNRIHPLIAGLELQRRGLAEGDAAPMFDVREGNGSRFKALLVVLGRIGGIVRTCGEIQVAAIEALQVEIGVVPIRQRLWDWFQGANVALDDTVVKHY